MSLKHIKCTVFFVIGCLPLILLVGCKFEQNEELKIKTSRSEKSYDTKFNKNNQNNISIEIDDDASVELDQWTSFFILQKEILKLKKNEANGFQESQKRIDTYFKGLDLDIPEIFNTNTVWARLKVLETEVYLYNEISNSDGAQKLLKTARENVVASHQNLIRQINKTFEKTTQNITK